MSRVAAGLTVAWCGCWVGNLPLVWLPMFTLHRSGHFQTTQVSPFGGDAGPKARHTTTSAAPQLSTLRPNNHTARFASGIVPFASAFLHRLPCSHAADQTAASPCRHVPRDAPLGAERLSIQTTRSRIRASPRPTTRVKTISRQGRPQLRGGRRGARVSRQHLHPPQLPPKPRREAEDDLRITLPRRQSRSRKLGNPP
jgi:hypothetical protein